MPPSSPLRRSPGRELIKESAHGRSHSLKNGFDAQDKDDKLALFDEINKHDREKMLVHLSNDFDALIGNVISGLFFFTHMHFRRKLFEISYDSIVNRIFRFESSDHYPTSRR